VLLLALRLLAGEPLPLRTVMQYLNISLPPLATCSEPGYASRLVALSHVSN
jgi:hypothetical protein